MSVGNLFQPNDYNLFCNEITANNINGPSGGVKFDNLTIESTGAQTKPALVINGTDSNQSIIETSVSNPGSYYILRNTNPTSFSNGFLFRNDLNGTTLQIGNNNGDNTGYLYAGSGNDLKIGFGNVEVLRYKHTTYQLKFNTPLDLDSNGYQKKYFKETTLPAFSAFVFSFPIPDNSNGVITATAQAFTATGLSLSRKICFNYKRMSGVPSILAQLEGPFATNENVSTNTASLSVSLSVNNLNVVVTSPVGISLQWSGFVENSYYS